MLLELAVADAYGAGFEYVEEPRVRRFNDLSQYHKHPKFDIGNGKYTDDTQMSLAIAELLVEKAEWTPLNIADKFVEVFRRDPRKGYARGFYQFLSDVKTGEEFLNKIHPDSDKSGAAMRASPIGFLPRINQVVEYATVQARLTHNTPQGINAAVASALMSHYFIHNLGRKKYLGTFIESIAEGDWSKPFKGEVSEKGHASVCAAITAITNGNSLSNILKRCVDFTGDTDTVATIALAAASCSKEVKQDLPQHLADGLENGEYGKNYLIDLDKRLKNKFGIC